MKFLAVCLLSALILGAVFEWLLAIGVGLLIALCYVGVDLLRPFERIYRVTR